MPSRTKKSIPDRANEIGADDPFSVIAATATELFARQGYHATGVAELGRAVGLGSGALYHHIGSKEELLFAICRTHLENVLKSGKELLDKDISASEKLRELAREHMRQVAYRTLELRVMLREMDALTGLRKHDMQELRDGVEQVWNEVIRQGIDSGELPHVDPFFTKVALGALNYAVLWFHADGPASAEEAGDRIMHMLLAGQTGMDRGQVNEIHYLNG